MRATDMFVRSTSAMVYRAPRIGNRRMSTCQRQRLILHDSSEVWSITFLNTLFSICGSSVSSRSMYTLSVPSFDMLGTAMMVVWRVTVVAVGEDELMDVVKGC